MGGLVGMKPCSSRDVAATVVIGCLLALSSCAGLNNVRELDAGELYRPSAQKAVLLYGSELQQPWPDSSMPRPTGLDFQEYDASAGRNKGNCWRSNHTQSVIDVAKVGVPKFSAFVVDPGHFVLNAFSAPGRAVADEAAFYAAQGTVSYVGTYVYKGEKDGFALRRSVAEGRAAAEQFPGLEGPVVMAPTIPVRENGIFVCGP